MTNKRRRIKTSYQKAEESNPRSYDINSSLNGVPIIKQDVRVLRANYLAPQHDGWYAALLGIGEEQLTPKQRINEAGQLDGAYTLKGNDLIAYWALYCDNEPTPTIVSPLPAIEKYNGAGGTYTLSHVTVSGQMVTRWTDLSMLLRGQNKRPHILIDNSRVQSVTPGVVPRNMTGPPPASGTWTTGTWADSMRRAEAQAAADPDNLRDWSPLGKFDYRREDIHVEGQSTPIVSHTWTEEKKTALNNLRRMMRSKNGPYS